MLEITMWKQAIFKIICVVALTREEVNEGAGDNSNARANRDALVRLYNDNGKKAVAAEYNVNDLESLYGYIKENPNHHFLLLGVGVEGVKAIKNVNSNVSKNKYTSIILSHQMSHAVEEAKQVADIIAVSSHAISKADEQLLKKGPATYVPLVGASTTLTEEEINSNYLRIKKELDSDKPVIGFIFGGDARMPDGSVKPLSIENAKQLGEYIAREAKNINGIVELVDGPRAGAHLGRKDGEINPVIAAFISAVQKQGIEIRYFPFIQDKAKREASPSAYRALFKVATKIFYTKESISTGFEFGIILMVLGKGIAIESESTLPEHKKYAENMHELGFLSLVFVENGKFVSKELIPERAAKEPLNRDVNSIRIMYAVDQHLKPEIENKR
jgi:hypothetical protein